MKILGYSERGILNTLLYEIRYAYDGDRLLGELIKEAVFPCGKTKPSIDSATILVEQSLSEFGDSDAIILCSSDAGKCVIFVEAKVKTYRSIHAEFQKFKAGLESCSSPDKFTSNLFTQIYFKQKLVTHGICRTNRKAPFSRSFFTMKKQNKKITERNIGNNKVVLNVVDEVKKHNTNAFYLMLVPDGNKETADFFANFLQKENDQIKAKIREWNIAQCGYLTWRRVETFCEKNKLNDTLAVFEHNRGQIYEL